MTDELRLTAIGGPTLLIEYRGLRLLTDPTFDPAGGDYPVGPVVLRKTGGPALSPAELGPLDAVLLTHDQHADNLDAAGRAALARAPRVLTTEFAAGRLGGAAIGLAPWASIDLPGTDGVVRVTATPARHGPPGCEPMTGDVIGFVLAAGGAAPGEVYLSGDTVWYEGVAEVARRFAVTTAVLFLGAARLREVGPAHLTMDAADAVEAARAFAGAVVVPTHFEGWAHFSEGRAEVERAFAAAGLGHRLRWLTPGVPEVVGR
jgi:L-ascorbate metabolism protein UlaG (beta-lactamase superfamily)